MIAFDHKQLVDLVQNRLSGKDLEIGATQLGKHYDCIDIFEIVDIYVHNPGVEGAVFGGSNFTFRERLEQLKELNGYVHLAGGLACGIENQLIKDFRITKKYLEPIAHFTREEILHFHGTPNYELAEDDVFYAGISITGYILVYEDKKLNFHIDAGTSKLTEINTHQLDVTNMQKR